jgi:hypothetical protein
MSLTEGMSVADIAAVTRNDGFGGFGEGSAWWLIILFLFMFNGVICESAYEANS